MLSFGLWKEVLWLILTVGYGDADCTSRRCLAQMLISKQYVSQPQNENCTQTIRVPFIEYQTLSVDTKNLRLISRLHARLAWHDPDLTWDTSVYPYDEVVLPVVKVWTPELHVTNGVKTVMKHNSLDLLVNSNGTVRHSVIINAEVNCEINLFNYPFASDECPVAIQTWSQFGCGSDLVLDKLKVIDSSHGDWKTEHAELEKKGDDRNYILVSLTIRYTNPFITLLLPTFLIILADVVSFALPLGGGERNSFKVTLVLSFTMFIIILNDELPGDGTCSPIIRTHFCVCLVLLVMSMLVSMVLTRLAKDGRFVFCCCSKGSGSKSKGNTEKEDEEVKADIGFVKLKDSDEKSRMLRKVVDFVEVLKAQTLESERNHMFADKVDKIFLWFYLILGTAYMVGMTCVMVKHSCAVNHFDFWYD